MQQDIGSWWLTHPMSHWDHSKLLQKFSFVYGSTITVIHGKGI